MAGQNITSGTTTANTVSQVTFARWYSSVEVVNSGANDMWVRVDGTNPTVSGDDCQLVPSRTWVVLSNLIPKTDPGGNVTNITDIRMISTVATTFTVSGGV